MDSGSFRQLAFQATLLRQRERCNDKLHLEFKAIYFFFPPDLVQLWWPLPWLGLTLLWVTCAWLIILEIDGNLLSAWAAFWTPPPTSEGISLLGRNEQMVPGAVGQLSSAGLLLESVMGRSICQEEELRFCASPLRRWITSLLHFSLFSVLSFFKT